MNEMEAGRRDLRRALEIDPGLRQGWLNRAALDLADGEHAAAGLGQRLCHHLGLLHRDALLYRDRSGDSDQPDSAAQCSASQEHCRSTLADRSGNGQQMTVVSFM